MNQHLKFIKDLINLDLNKGPIITGSFMTWILETQILNCVPSWNPDDLDICCLNENQFKDVKKILEPISTITQETNWLGSSSSYFTINDFKYQAFVFPGSVSRRLKKVDFTITAIAFDGKQYITGDTTFNDISNKSIKLNDNPLKWPVESIMSRYSKYINRGYVDINNQTLLKLKKLYET